MAYRITIALVLSFLTMACLPQERLEEGDYSSDFVNIWWEFTDGPLALDAIFGECFMLNHIDEHGGELYGFSEENHVWLISDWWFTMTPNIYRVDEQYEMSAHPGEDDCWHIEYEFLSAIACDCALIPRIAK